MANRNIQEALRFIDTIKDKGADIPALAEKGKNQFVGPELRGKTLGVIGLGAIGIQVASAAVKLDMNVLGYDPYLSASSAWHLDNRVQNAEDINTIFSKCDYISIHAPLTPDTRGFINKNTIKKMRDGVRIINCARGELVNNDDMKEALKSGKIAKYITDFPCQDLISEKNVLSLPHIGASTPEAEENCAIMAAKELRDYLEQGNIQNSINYPKVSLPRSAKHRTAITHKNQNSKIATATTMIGDAKINIASMLSVARGDLAYMLIDTDEPIPPAIISAIKSTDGILEVTSY
jgi:D-3-phosphoglycerate dehydrogenase